MMEQYLIRVPKSIGTELRNRMEEKEMRGVDVVAGADNKHFKFHIGEKELPATLCQLPCIVETHKTYDDNLFYKSGEIGQILLVHESPEEQMQYETVTELPSGITPPTTNIVKRKYSKTRKYPIFPPQEIARVEDMLVKIAGGGVIEEVQEELVDFCDWMIDEEHPNGIIVTDEMEFIKKHPEYLDLTNPNAKSNGNGNNTDGGHQRSFGSSGMQSLSNSRPDTDVDEDLRTPADGLSEDEKSNDINHNSKETSQRDGLDDDLDDLMNEDDEEDEEGDMSVSLDKNPQYQELLSQRLAHTKKLQDLRKDASKVVANIQSTTNPIMRSRYQAQKDSLDQEMANVQVTLDKTNGSIQAMERRG